MSRSRVQKCRNLFSHNSGVKIIFNNGPSIVPLYFGGLQVKDQGQKRQKMPTSLLAITRQQIFPFISSKDRTSPILNAECNSERIINPLIATITAE